MRKSLKGLAAVALVGTLAFGNGCVSLGARPYTSGEKFWSGVAVTAHAADMGITRYGVSRGFLETNPLYGEDAKIERLLAVKTAYLGITYGLGEAFPERRKLFYKIATIAGAVPFLLDAFILITYSPQDEQDF